MISLICSGCNGPILQIRKVGLRDQGHTASELWNENSSLSVQFQLQHEPFLPLQSISLKS